MKTENEPDSTEAPMADKKGSPAMDFVISQLKKDPNTAYRDIKEAANKKGLAVYPIMYGRAKALLGLVEVSPRGSGKRAREREAREAREARERSAAPLEAPRRGPGRNRDSGSGDPLEAMIANVREVQEDRSRYREALQKIAQILDDVLR